APGSHVPPMWWQARCGTGPPRWVTTTYPSSLPPKPAPSHFPSVPGRVSVRTAGNGEHPDAGRALRSAPARLGGLATVGLADGVDEFLLAHLRPAFDVEPPRDLGKVRLGGM